MGTSNYSDEVTLDRQFDVDAPDTVWMTPQPLKVYARNLFDRHKLDAALDALSGTVAEPEEWDAV